MLLYKLNFTFTGKIMLNQSNTNSLCLSDQEILQDITNLLIKSNNEISDDLESLILSKTRGKSGLFMKVFNLLNKPTDALLSKYLSCLTTQLQHDVLNRRILYKTNSAVFTNEFVQLLMEKYKYILDQVYTLIPDTYKTPEVTTLAFYLSNEVYKHIPTEQKTMEMSFEVIKDKVASLEDIPQEHRTLELQQEFINSKRYPKNIQDLDDSLLTFDYCLRGLGFGLIDFDDLPSFLKNSKELQIEYRRIMHNQAIGKWSYSRGKYRLNKQIESCSWENSFCIIVDNQILDLFWDFAKCFLEVRTGTTLHKKFYLAQDCKFNWEKKHFLISNAISEEIKAKLYTLLDKSKEFCLKKIVSVKYDHLGDFKKFCSDNKIMCRWIPLKKQWEISYSSENASLVDNFNFECFSRN